jgi:hypothetical protein
MPSKADIQIFQNKGFFWTPVFTGVTIFLNSINNENTTIGYKKKCSKRFYEMIFLSLENHRL